MVISFPLAGHTKFAPDRFFGQIKRKLRCINIRTLFDIDKAVEECSRKGRNLAELCGLPDGTLNIPVYD